MVIAGFVNWPGRLDIFRFQCHREPCHGPGSLPSPASRCWPHVAGPWRVPASWRDGKTLFTVATRYNTQVVS